VENHFHTGGNYTTVWLKKRIKNGVEKGAGVGRIVDTDMASD
jgi:hypothetical protein